MARRAPNDRLKSLAKQLRAERTPYYLRHRDLPAGLFHEFPAEGWYWIPCGEHTTSYLGRDSYDAHHCLMTLIEKETSDAAP